MNAKNNEKSIEVKVPQENPFHQGTFKFFELIDSMKKINLENSKELLNNLLYLASYGNILTIEESLNQLPILSKVFVTNLKINEIVSVKKEKQTDAFDIYLTKVGRLLIFNEKLCNYKLKDDDYFIGSVIINDGLKDLIIMKYNEIINKEKFYFNYIEKQINIWFNKNEFKEVCKIVQTISTHIETIYINIENNTYIKSNANFSSTEILDNITKDNLFIKISEKSKDSLTYNEKLLIVSLMSLYESYYEKSVEELNGINLTPSKLYNILLDKYNSIVENYDPFKFNNILENESIIGLSKYLKTLFYPKIENGEIFMYRMINAFIFNKKAFNIKSDIFSKPIEIPIEIKEFCKRICVNYDEINADIFVENLLIKMSELKERPKDIFKDLTLDINWLEYLLYIICLSSKKHLECDYTFISGMKDICKLFEFKDKEELLKFNKDDFFCLISDWYQPWCKELTKGMQYNRWCELGESIHELYDSNTRYYRILLKFPDICYEEYYHHKAHEFLNLNSAFRFGIPSRDCDALKYNGIKFKECYDLRGFRTSKKIFSLKELEMVGNYLNLIDKIFRKIVELKQKKNIHLKIENFGIEFYNSLKK